MKKFETPAPVKLVCGVLYGSNQWLEQALIDLPQRFGEPDFQSEPIDFTFTDYYYKEMGKPLYRVFLSFKRLVDPSELAQIKLFTNTLEEKYGSGGHRVFNLDPGYLNATAYILATSKNYSHRIYLGSGVFAQQELLFERQRVRTLDWTYPDYRSIPYHEIFKQIHKRYVEQIRELSGLPRV